MSGGEGDIDAPMEAVLAPFRCYAASVARAQEGALAFAEAAAELNRSAVTLYAQQMQLCLGWSAVTARMLERPHGLGGLDTSSAVVSLLQEQMARGFSAVLQFAGSRAIRAGRRRPANPSTSVRSPCRNN